MTADEYQQAAARTECDEERARVRIAFEGNAPHHPDGLLIPTRLFHVLSGLASETGELADSIKRWVFHGQPLDRDNVAEELGDLLWYVALACNALGLSMGGVMAANVAKLRARFPERYTDWHADEVNRDRAAESKAAKGG